MTARSPCRWQTNPAGATLSGDLTATASDGVAVFDGLSLNETGDGYSSKITSSDFPSVTTSSLQRDGQHDALGGYVLPGGDRQPACADISDG